MPAETVATRLMGELGRLAETETRFYRELSPELTGVPASLRLRVRSDDGPVRARPGGSRRPIPVSFPTRCTRSTRIGPPSSSSCRHGCTRRSGAGCPAGSIPASADTASLLTGPLLKTSSRAHRRAHRHRRGARAGSSTTTTARWRGSSTSRPHTVMHGDAHPGNVYFRNGAAGLLDWQAVRRGHPSRELAYTLVTSMTTDDRQADTRATCSTSTAGAGRGRRTGVGPRRIVGSVPPGRAVRLRRGADHRRDGRHAGRGHRARRAAAQRRRAGGSRHGRRAGEVAVTNRSTIVRSPTSEARPRERTATRRIRHRRGHLDSAPDPGRDHRGAGPQRADQAEPVRGRACRPGCPARRCTAGSPPRRNCSTRSASTSARCSTTGIARATAGLRGTERLDAALRFIVDYQQSYSGVRLVDIEPEVVIAQLTNIIPMMRARLQKLLQRPERSGQGGHRDSRRRLALHRPQRRRRPVPGAAAARHRDQGEARG